MMINNHLNKFCTVRQLANYYPAFTEGSIRWLIFNEMSNGFNQCIRRLGRKILIDLDQFELWIGQQNKPR